jgi:hypothetical protein
MGLAKAAIRRYQRGQPPGDYGRCVVRGATVNAETFLTAPDRGSAKVPEWRRSKLLKYLAKQLGTAFVVVTSSILRP